MMSLCRSKKTAEYDWDNKELIGNGMLCEVYKCEQANTRGEPPELVAIKRFKNPTMSEEECNMIGKAFSMAKDWDHMNINAVRSLEFIDGYHTLVMDYADLGNLENFKFKNDAQKIKSALDIVKGLEYLHTEKDEENGIIGVIHRNLKPANVLFKTGSKGRVVTQLGDAGFGKVLTSNIENTQFEDSPEYRAPEVIEGSEYDLKADIYSLSTILYEMFMGQPYPMPKFKNSVANMLKVIKKHERPSMVELDDKYQLLASLIKRGWNIEPTERPSLKEFYIELLKLEI